MEIFRKLVKVRFFLAVLFVAFLVPIIFIYFFKGNQSASFSETLSHLLYIFIGFTVFVFVMSLAGIWDVISILGYLKKMSEAIQKVASGNFNVKIGIKRRDEIGELARNLEWMKEELRKNFEGMKKEEEKLNAIVDNVGDAIIVLDNRKKIILANLAAQKLIAHTEEETRGMEYYKFLRLFDKEKQIFICNFDTINNEDCPVEKAIVSKKIVFIPKGIYLINKYGVKIEIDGSVAPYKDLRGEIMGYVIVLRDVTSEREVERMKSEFVSITSHQLRTPLSSIRWYVEMLLDGDAGELNKLQKDFTSEVHQSTKKAIELINNLLDLSRIEGGTIKYSKQLISPEQIIEDTISDVIPLAEASNIKIIKKLGKEAMPKISVDYQKVFQVIQNLVVNAINYSKGKSEVILSLEKNDKEVIFSCKDSGIGIPKGVQKDLFKKFFRAENATVVNAQGSGIGLFICKVFAEGMGGRIWFESEGEDKGSTFYVGFPIADR